MLRVLVYQYDIVWENPDLNHIRIEEQLGKFFADDRADIVVLPEFFATGFTMNGACAQDMQGKSLTFLKYVSQKFNSAVVGSVPVAENGLIYNRSLFVTPEGVVYQYDKKHLFRMSSENDLYSPGKCRTVFEYKGWKIALNVCYDLRFPVWSRNVENQYDLMINVASWPQQRISAAQILAKARAIENQSYYIFANRSGDSPYEKYNGGSMIVDYKGNDIAAGENGILLTADLDLEGLRNFRSKFPAWMDADMFKIE